MIKGSTSIALALCIAAFSGGATAAGPPSENLPTTFSGKLWFVSNNGLVAKFPVPAATPDVTFMTRHISFFSSAPNPAFPAVSSVDNFVSAFLKGNNHVSSVAYSGLLNPIINQVVTPETITMASDGASCGTYGIFMELTGSLFIKHNQVMIIAADDGASLMIDGQVQSGDAEGGFYTGYIFTGKSANHAVDIAYANGCGVAYLNFSRAM